MAKRHYIPITSDVPGVSDSKCAFIRKVIRTALAAEGVDFPCEIDVRLTDDETIHEINREMREVDRATDVLSFPMFELTPGELPGEEDAVLVLFRMREVVLRSSLSGNTLMMQPSST